MSAFIKKSLLATVAVAPLIMGGASVNAQEADDGDDYSPRGIRAGSFMFYPKLELTETHNDNLYAVSTGKTSDWVTDILPTLKLDSDWNNHSLKLKAKADVRRHKNQSAEDVEEFGLSADVRLDVKEETEINLGASQDWKTEERSSPDDSGGVNPGEYTKQSLDAGFSHQPNRVSISLDGTYDKSNYDDTTGATGTVTDNDDRDRTKREGTIRIGYEIVPEYEAFVTASYNDINYVTDTDDVSGTVLNRNSDGYKIHVGTAIDLSGVLDGDAAIGYMAQNYTDASLLDPSGWSADVSLTWTPTELTKVKGTLSRSIDETTTSSVSSLVNTAYGVTVDHELRRNISLGAGVKMSSNDQQGSTTSDDTLTLSANVDYKINRNFYAGADYQRKDKDSTTNTSDYLENVFKITLGAQF